MNAAHNIQPRDIMRIFAARHNAHIQKVTAKFLLNYWNLRAGYILVCYKSNSRNDVGEGEEAVAKRVDSNGMWYASNALLFSIGKLEIILIPIHHFLIFYLSCAGEQKISALFQFRILSCV
jgi:hypothetical protein